MADTPFIDILSDKQRAIVAKKARGEDRPYYYDSAIAQAEDYTGEGSSDGLVQISQDFEAVLILAPNETKKEMLNFIQAAGRLATNLNADDFALMGELVALRQSNYSQISRDVGETVLEFDAARAKLNQFVENTARSNATIEQTNPDTAAVTAVVVPDLAAFFASLQDAYSAMSKPDDLAVHDRISDAGILYTVQNAALERSRELSSWGRVFQTYLA